MEYKYEPDGVGVIIGIALTLPLIVLFPIVCIMRLIDKISGLWHDIKAEKSRL